MLVHRRTVCRSEPRPSGSGPSLTAHSSPPLRSGLCKRRSGFTLVELLVVIAIIALLVAALVAAGSAVFEQGKIKETKAVLFALEQAINQFESDAPLSKVSAYLARYGNFPCDELEGFVNGVGIPIQEAPGPTIGPGGMSNLALSGTELVNIEHRDTKAMNLVMRLYSSSAVAILDKIAPKYRRTSAREFLDRNGNTALDTDDEPLTHYVDAWGTPIEYFALRGKTPPLAIAGTDSMMGDRLKASAAFVAANHGRPLLVSYGPDGPDQLEAYAATTDTPHGSPLVSDYNQTQPTLGVIDNPLNEDNVYVDDTIKARLGNADAS